MTARTAVAAIGPATFTAHAGRTRRTGLRRTRTAGSAEYLAGELMLIRLDDAERAVTVGTDKAYDTADFVETCTALRVAPHVARNTSGRRSNIEDEVAASAPYRTSLVHRKRIEEVFAWVKTVADLSKTRHRGLARVDWQFPGARGLRSDPSAEASGGTGMSVETGDRPTGTLRTMETGLSARLRRDTRDLWCQNHETRRSDEINVSNGLRLQRPHQGLAEAAFSATC